MFLKPLRAYQNHPTREKNRPADSKNQTLDEPSVALFRLSYCGVSQCKPRKHKNPPPKFDAVHRHIHKTVEHHCEGRRDHTPA